MQLFFFFCKVIRVFLALLWVSVKITQLYYCGLKSIMDNIQRASLFVDNKLYF